MTTESHGYLILGDKLTAINWSKEKSSILLGISVESFASCQDFSIEEYDIFGIDESRRLKERAFMRPFGGDKKIFIIYSRVFTFEAQNALLKLFEEPPLGTHFFIIAQNLSNLLPTLISRLVMIRFEEKIFSDEENGKAKDFLAKNPAERLLMINNMIDKKSKDEMDTFLNNLEYTAVKKIEKKDKVFVDTIESIQKSREYINTRGSSLKLVFEYLALSLPII